MTVWRSGVGPRRTSSEMGRYDTVEKVPKYGAANFPLKDKTSGDSKVTIPNLSLVFVVPVIIAGVSLGLGPSLCSAIPWRSSLQFFPY